MKKRFLALALSTLFAAAPRAGAALLINIYNNGSDVQLDASGSFNYLPTGNIYFGGVATYVNPQLGVVGLFPNSYTQLKSYSLISSPANFGTLGYAYPDLDIATDWNFNLSKTAIVLPSNYTAGTSVSGAATFTGNTIGSLGMTAGTYYYTWGDGVNTDTATLVISASPPGPGPSPVPEPGTWAAAAMLLGGAGFAGWRKRRKVS